PQHGRRVGGVGRLTEHIPIQHHFGIGTQHPRPSLAGDLGPAGGGLVAGHAQHVIGRGLAGGADLGNVDVEQAVSNAQAVEQFGPPRGLGSQIEHGGKDNPRLLAEPCPLVTPGPRTPGRLTARSCVQPDPAAHLHAPGHGPRSPGDPPQCAACSPRCFRSRWPSPWPPPPRPRAWSRRSPPTPPCSRSRPRPRPARPRISPPSPLAWSPRPPTATPPCARTPGR